MTQRLRLVEIPDRLWTGLETAKFLSIDKGTLYQLNANRSGPRYFKVGRECRYDPRDVVAWLETRASDRVAA